MKIAAISDLHGDLPATPECDLLLIGGDVCPMSDHAQRRQREWLLGTFAGWLKIQPAERIVWIAGNHDFAVQDESFAEVARELPAKSTYIEDQLIEIDGLRVWGTPWVTHLPRWAFNADEEHLRTVTYAGIEPCEVLMTHAPPRGTPDTHSLDFTCPAFGSKHVGSPAMRDRIEELNPRVVICGHIHEGNGRWVSPAGTEMLNVAHMDETFSPRDGAAVVFDL